MPLLSPSASIAAVRANLGDTGRTTLLSDEVIDSCIQEAATTDYSRARPRVLTVDLPGDGQLILLAGLPGWVDGLARVSQVEYPATDTDSGTLTEALEPGRDYRAPYPTPDGDALLFLSVNPASTETVRIVYYAPHQHLAATDTVPAGDRTAVLALATSLACLRAATKAAAAEDQTIMADGVNRSSASGRYQSLAKEWRTRYLEHLGQSQGASSGRPVLEFHDWTPQPSTGGRRWLTH